MSGAEMKSVVSGVNGFGASLRRRRRSEGWSQAELEERSGVDQGTISALEVGRSKPTAETVRRLADAFRLPVETLAREAGHLDPDPPPPPSDIFDRTPLARIDGLLRELPVAVGFPSFTDQLRQLEGLPVPVQERVLRRLARDFLWRLREELEREEGEA